MNAQNSNEHLRETSDAVAVVSNSRRPLAHNYLLIWLDTENNKANEHYQYTLERLQNVADTVNIFTNRDECVDFLTEFEGTKTFLIIDDTIGQQIFPLIHDIPQLDKVYVFCSKTCLHNEWIKEWAKVKGFHTEIDSLCAAIKIAIKQHNQNSIALSFISSFESDSDENLDKLEPSFMYTQIMREILFNIKHDDKSLHDFITFCRSNNCGSPNDVELFEKEYNNQLAILWYTRPTFIYSVLNYALRTFQTDIIIKMAFFIFDLHAQIEQLYRDQCTTYNGKTFVVHRGQALSKIDFEKLRQTKGGLISFNSFLSTTVDPEVSLCYAESNAATGDMVGILFVITIDSNISSAPFAFIKSLSNFKEEDEILFSMHAVFRIDDVKQSLNHSGLYEVKLRLTADDDEQLRSLTKCLAKEIKGDTGWQRLGNLLIRIGELDQAEQLYNTLLEQTSNEQEKLYYYKQLGYVKYEQNDYRTAGLYYLKTAQTTEKTISSNYPDVINASSDNIGLTYYDIDEYTRITLFYNKQRINEETSFTNDHPSTDSSESLFYEKALRIYEKSLSSNDSYSGISSNDIDKVCNETEKPLQILWFNKKLLEIREKILPPNHPDLAISYHNIGALYQDMNEHSDALPFYEKALRILEQNLPPNHPHLGTVYNNIGIVYYNIGECSIALSFCKKALDIRQRGLHSNDPQLINSYQSMGEIYEHMEQYPEAIFFYEKAFGCDKKQFQIEEETPHPDYSHLRNCYHKSAKILESKREYSDALLFYTKALRICEKTLPPDSSDMAAVYNNIGGVYYQMEDYSKALLHLEHALNILKDSTSEDDPRVKTIQDNISYIPKKS